ncbi:unnamed protein product [Ambrosiozyma monospora]|uniref:Unnamed protein product n=1 Tax=Ambrosiozyma monospora TaxID=43982 RepID=A0A9W6YVT2_AMBMO|nr:unnamed protein product [Ambrosiozyma monospora]
MPITTIPENNLDIRLIAPNLAVSSCPSDNPIKFYQAKLSDVITFLNSVVSHCSSGSTKKWMMINLRAESIGYKWPPYEPNEFLNIKIPDHTPPGFRRLLDTIKVLHRHQDDFKLIHCKHGKGRTGTVVICYLIWKFNLSFDEANSLFVKKRKVYSSGVTICSQARYCRYLESFMKLEESTRVHYIDLLKNHIVSAFELEQIEIFGAIDLSSHGKFIVKLRQFCEDETDVEEFMQFKDCEITFC